MHRGIQATFELGNGRAHSTFSPREGVRCSPRTASRTQGWPCRPDLPYSLSFWPELGPGRVAGFSTLEGCGPCPLGPNKSLQVLLVSQSSGRHCAPVKVQGNLGSGEMAEKAKTKHEGSGVNHDPLHPQQAARAGTLHPGQWWRPQPRHQAFHTYGAFSPPITLQSKYFDCPHFRDEETEGQRDELSDTAQSCGLEFRPGLNSGHWA